MGVAHHLCLFLPTQPLIVTEVHHKLGFSFAYLPQVGGVADHFRERNKRIHAFSLHVHFVAPVLREACKDRLDTNHTTTAL